MKASSGRKQTNKATASSSVKSTSTVNGTNGQILPQTGGFRGIKSKIKWRFASLPIRNKLIIIFGILVIGLISILSFTLIQNGKRLLTERLAQSCELSLQHVSQNIKDDLLIYYKNELDANARSAPLGVIREAILEVFIEGIDGLEYSQVVGRDGRVIAHSNNALLNSQVSAEDSLFYAQLKTKYIREQGDLIEHIHPIYARRGSGETVYLGVATLGFARSIIMAPVKKATQAVLYATLAITVISFILIYFVAHRITRQIEELGRGVQRISEGDLKSEIPILSNDELGQLAREFNAMIKHLHEKLYMQKFVSKYTIKMIRDRYAHGLPMEGESRNVTLLFSDIRNFSNLTERLSAREIVNLINIYLDVQAQIIEKNQGVVDKYMGDQVMAIFDGEKQEDRAVQTAIEIQRAIRLLNHKRAELGIMTLNVGIGINSGQAVMGNMGSKNRMDYTVIGDVVNLASRLCAIAQPGQIIAPIELSSLLNGDYPKIQLNPVWVKGRSKPVATFEVDYDHAIIM
ncbi:MAG: HAMP domain-containing protein [Calditrichaeota bacterium]|nr:MAG: HAMP domain-containing protein [Calditrichota bacterium]